MAQESRCVRKDGFWDMPDPLLHQQYLDGSGEWSNEWEQARINVVHIYLYLYCIVYLYH